MSKPLSRDISLFTSTLTNNPALRRVRATDASSKVNFTVVYYPYQLYPEATQEGESKYEWYKKSRSVSSSPLPILPPSSQNQKQTNKPYRYGDSEEKMRMYTTLMSAYGASAGITYKFGGTVANTLQSHRVIQYFQESKGPVVADRLVNSLYRQYFEEEAHPSSDATLLAACLGIYSLSFL
jgi:hypothetical protein